MLLSTSNLVPMHQLRIRAYWPTAQLHVRAPLRGQCDTMSGFGLATLASPSASEWGVVEATPEAVWPTRRLA